MTIQHLYPTTRPSLDLNFARQKRLDSRVTFTRGSTATYVGSNGLIKTAAANEARFDHDPVTGESLGLLVEEARTNTFYPSVPNSTWTGGGAFLIINAGSAPDGTNTAALSAWNTVSGAERILYNSGTPTSVGITEVHSFFIKAANPGSGDVWRISFFGSTWAWLGNGGGPGSRLFSFDFDTETFSANLGTDFGETIFKYPNGWYRVCIPAINNGTGSFSNYMTMNRHEQAGNWYIWGWQREDGSFPTSYIPTTSSTVTRSADVASMTGTNFSSFWNNNAGSVLFDGIPKTSNKAAVYWSAHNTASRGYELYVNGSGAMYHYINFGANILLNPISAGTRYRVCSAFDTSNINSSVNGGSVISASGVAATGISTFNIGKAYSGYTMNGHISRLTYYPTRLTDAQLQELTR